MLIIDGYTFSEYNKNFWYCTKRRFDCPAKAKTYPDGSIKTYCSIHNHVPPKFQITDNGYYVRLH